MDEKEPTPASPEVMPYEDYVPGFKDTNGKVVKTVVGKHRHLLVYITEDDAIAWRYQHLPDRLRPAVAEFQLLNGLARSTVGKKHRPRVAMVLGPALYAALLSAEGDDFKSHFTDARRFIHAKGTEAARLAYVVLALLFGALVTALVLALFVLRGGGHDFTAGLLLGVAGGTIGALVSTIQRVKDVQVDPLDSGYILALHGVTRLVLGGLFGVLFVVACKANIALGHFANDEWALLGLAAGAGFTERWVPELLGHQG